MHAEMLSERMLKTLLVAQKNEITEYHIYSLLSKSIKDKKNSRILQSIADDELRHYNFFKQYTKKEIKPGKWKIFKFYWISRLFGITFGVKLMEKDEENAQINYDEISKTIPEVKEIEEEENTHEMTLINLIEEEHLSYMGSVVLGLNDALVELTGALAGFTFALQRSRLIALAGLITGIAASFSMAASEYLSNKAEGQTKRALKSSLYTGIAYIITVFLLILPYLFLSNYFVCLGITLFIALLIIFIFNYYISVVRDLSFKKRFLEMAFISLGVALLSFGIGYVIRIFVGVDI
jgi:VIT1/CCC1 family predicted Fe2+/Mn2+ transporter